jgi:hypothetical protein
LRPVTWPRLQKSRRCTSCTSDIVPNDRETPTGSLPRVFRPMCELLHTVSANQTCNGTSLLLRQAPLALNAQRSPIPGVPGRADCRSVWGEPACTLRDRAAARLDSEQFRFAPRT